MSLINRKINIFAKPVSSLPDHPSQAGMTAASLKAAFDANANGEIKNSINGIVDDLVSAVDSASGADNIGATALKTGGATTVQGQLEELNANKVSKDGDETIAGIKTFSSAPLIPAPSAEMHPTTKKYVDDRINNVNMGDANKLGGQLPSYYATAEQITNLDAQKATKTELATTNAIVEQKADKSEVTNVMTPKGNISYASLPITGNTIGWYYYCSDGDGVNGAGNYVWNGVSWYFGGTGDEGYNIVREDLGDNFSEHDGIVEHDNSTNLIDRTTFTNGYIIDGAVDGQPLQISNFQVSDFFRVEPNKTYYFGSFFGGYYAYYDRTKKYIGGCGNSNGANYLILSSPFTTPSNADIAYMRITLNSSVSTQKPKNAWMNETNWSADSTITTANYPVKSNKLKNDVNLNSKHLSMINNIVNGIDDNPCNYKGNEITVFKKIVCIGDSITQGTFNHNETGTMAYMTSNDYSYPNYLTKLTGIVTDNMGRGGYTSVQFQEAYVNHDWSGVDCAIINFGINDALQGVSADDSRTALRALIDSLKGDNINIKIFIATVVPAYADGVTTFNAINDTIRYLAETTPDVYLIDLTKYSHVNKDTVYEAGHLTALGYCRLAKDYISAISSIIKNNIDDFKYVAFIGTNYTYNV